MVDLKDFDEAVDALERNIALSKGSAISKTSKGKTTDLNKRRALTLLEEVSNRIGELYEKITVLEEEADTLEDKIMEDAEKIKNDFYERLNLFEKNVMALEEIVEETKHILRYNQVDPIEVK